MEDLFGLIVWIFIIAASISSKKKKQAKKQAKRPEPNPWEEMLKHAPGQTGQIIRQAVESAASKPAPAQPVQMSMPLPTTAETPAGSFVPLAPTVHTHLEPDCEVHDAPGSLGHVSTEGKDPCHEEQFAPLTTAQPLQEEQPGLALSFTGENLVQAFVMQEVLTRPCDRRPRGYAR